ncbi:MULTISPECIES: phosphopantetheine-binding protein [Streptomyces]|uniref:phosphopantetheine-binding protein n=1 Tax=Streptomyces TaxID=1883 RepID=UPI000AED8DC2|nr:MULTISPECIES: phosphopantetheine-binding protein [Streptomyces]
MDHRPTVDGASARDALGMSSGYVAPRTTTEHRLAVLWDTGLGVSPVGVEDDFFELGGDSLLAAELQLAIDQEFGVEVPAAALFLTPTIAALAEAVEAAEKNGAAPGPEPAR